MPDKRSLTEAEVRILQMLRARDTGHRTTSSRFIVQQLQIAYEVLEPALIRLEEERLVYRDLNYRQQFHITDAGAAAAHLRAV